MSQLHRFTSLIKTIKGDLFADDPQPTADAVRLYLSEFEAVIGLIQAHKDCGHNLAEVEQMRHDLNLIYLLLKQERSDRTGKLVVRQWLTGTDEYQDLADVLHVYEHLFEPEPILSSLVMEISQ